MRSPIDTPSSPARWLTALAASLILLALILVGGTSAKAFWSPASGAQAASVSRGEHQFLMRLSHHAVIDRRRGHYRPRPKPQPKPAPTPKPTPTPAPGPTPPPVKQENPTPPMAPAPETPAPETPTPPAPETPTPPAPETPTPPAPETPTPPAPETPTPPALTPPTPPILDAGFENGLQGWNTSGATEKDGAQLPTVVSGDARVGTHYARVVLEGGQQRSELTLGGAGNNEFGGTIKVSPADTYYYAFSLRLPSQMQWGGPGKHNTVFQLHGYDDNEALLQLQLWNATEGAGKTGKGLWVSGPYPNSRNYDDRFVSAAVLDGKWHDIVVGWAADWYTIWLDGKEVYDQHGRDVFDGNHSAYVKNGLYRGNLSGTSEVDLDAARIGTSTASVLPG